MGHKVLVANRGEIAVRVFRSVRARGWGTLAVFTDDDRGSLHVTAADHAVRLETKGAVEPYQDIEQLIEVALAHDVWGIHPGYGFLSENPQFARAVEDAGLVFIGPTPEQIELFGDKQSARAQAIAAGVPVAAATSALLDADDARDQVSTIGLPVIMKAAAGGGGKGMAVIEDLDQIPAAFRAVHRVAESVGGGVFAERFIADARHVEVQIFGDGEGGVVTLGDRDCTLQRRNQKVVEEAPAYGLDDALRTRLHDTARALGAAAGYRSAGTVEFVVDSRCGEAAFLEINTRLQVEHPVTEAVVGVDLVDWMLALADGDDSFLTPHLESGSVPLVGHAVESRLYAEDAAHDFRPSPGTITHVEFPSHARVDTWVTTGTEVGMRFDPMLAKVITVGADRAEAWQRHASALAQTRVDGVHTNLGLLRAIADSPLVASGAHTTSSLGVDVIDPGEGIRVEDPGFFTTVQAAPGRLGLWHIGVPPSGPMDDRSFRLGNEALGNASDAAGLECTVSGPRLRFTMESTVCVTGAPASVTVDGEEMPMWEPFEVPAGSVLEVGRASAGLRTYVLVSGGLDVPDYLGSRATFTLGGFGGHAGRTLVAGDLLAVGTDRSRDLPHPRAVVEERLECGSEWEIGVLDGPHSSPDFFTPRDIEALFSASYQVHFNSDRTGVRLVGPQPEWARGDGGEAGLHPSNIHDTPYSVGGLDFTGDTPVLLGPDGPSLGGFVTPVTVVKDERWKLGQLAPGDTVRFARRTPVVSDAPGAPRGVLLDSDGVVVRRQGDDSLLVEFGPQELDLMLRARVHVLHERLKNARLAGVRDLTPGIRSLQIAFGVPSALTPAALETIAAMAADVADASDLVVPSRRVRLPLSWDDPATREAIARYEAGVRDDAPWNPWNIEFIRRVNGLDSVTQVFDTVFEAEYLVMGLGDVYLGAPVATPLDPRHRLVTTKYNPARTWTAENSVGIGGAYLCIYGMEGPGGYQFVGRTTQVWDRWASFEGADRAVDGSRPWLLEYFDRITWYEVTADELLRLRADFAAGTWRPEIVEGTLSLADHQQFLDENAREIDEFRHRQRTAFGAERARWEASGEFQRQARPAPVADDGARIAEGCEAAVAPFMANVWKVSVSVGDRVARGDVVAVLEAMKMEAPVTASVGGVVEAVLAPAGSTVSAGDPIVTVRADA
ncbi:5-oxoprolinase/urea amidolyase family protein [Demequina aestuarii]|uniref:5-oxoprolinase/urea amidolyase family protein n=1 Tax=Demequina aestuarii TaxID=327095 RepID=UPI000785DABE|nr:5-oxoprolinase/urea amidolyase family protein [Demequina aestuarii]